METWKIRNCASNNINDKLGDLFYVPVLCSIPLTSDTAMCGGFFLLGWIGSALCECEELGHLLLLCVKRSQLRCLLHLIRIPPGHRPLEVFWACPTWRPAG